jgi:hypothetical protein
MALSPRNRFAIEDDPEATYELRSGTAREQAGGRAVPAEPLAPSAVDGAPQPTGGANARRVGEVG